MTSLLHTLLEEAARRTPEQIAVEGDGSKLSYGALDERANRVARLLVDRGVVPGDRVGLFLEKSPEALVAIYGVLKAGAAYVPFDPQAPTARLGYMARDAGISHVITGIEKATTWSELVEHGAPVKDLFVLNGKPDGHDIPDGVQVFSDHEIAQIDAIQPSIDIDDSTLAYILYTSGSTGNPKGVMLSHRNALAFVDWAVAEFAVTSNDRLSSHAPFHFDLSIFDLFAAARAAATVVLVPPAASVFPRELARFLTASEVTVWYSVPSILSLLVTRGGLEAGSAPRLRTVLFAGEVFPTKYLYTLMDLLPHVRFYNLYGPTETNVCTWYEVPAAVDARPESIPIGKAITGVSVFAIDERGAAVPPGEVGELCVVGPTVMQGYWGDPQRTAERLVPAPTPIGNDLMYKTGDLCHVDEHGDFIFLGRRDAQIKSRGYRIELGEIETALYAHPSVVECAVAAIPDELVTNRIKAYVVVRDDTGAETLVRFCEQRLPRYMIPDLFDFRDELPKSSTGKIARTALEIARGATT